MISANPGLLTSLSALPEIQAIAVGGSQASGVANTGSDIDLYVFVTNRIDPDVRRVIASMHADDPTSAEIANPWWGDEDGYAIDGIWHDIVFFDLTWFTDEIARATVRQEARDGYSTCFVHTLMNLRFLFQRDECLRELQKSIPPYPEMLRHRIMATNFAVACGIHASYRNQIARAIELDDPVSLNHRTAAFVASVFDFTFAYIRKWHPGEKRQLMYLRQSEGDLPTGFTDALERVALGGTDVMKSVNQVVAGLEEMVLAADAETTLATSALT